MKSLFLLAVFLAGCTFTVSTQDSKQKKKPAVHGRGHTVKHAKKQSGTPENIKETWWIENYHKLEAAKGDYTIPDDDGIKPLPDGRFKVPDAVLKHYQDMLLAKPSPDARPSPSP